jgi:hypothetical protein
MKKRRALLLTLLALPLLLGSLAIDAVAHAQLPGDFGPNLHRVASVKSWQMHAMYEKAYQWLPDGRLLIWVGTEHYQPRLFDPKTGKLASLDLFDRLRRAASPPETGTLETYLAPDGKTTLSLLCGFFKSPAFYRTLTLDGYQMGIHPLPKNFAWKDNQTVSFIFENVLYSLPLW